jgi:putative hemolysin
VSDLSRIVLILLLVLGNAVFVAAEYALVTARRARLEPEAAAGSRTARAALDLMDQPVRFISTVQVGITLFSIALGAIGQPLLTDYFDPIVSYGIAYAAAFLILTYVSVVLGELVPKAIALQKAEQIAKALAFPLAFLQRLAKPFVWLLQVSANFVTRLFGIQPAPAGELAHSEEEIRHIVAGAEEAGVIEAAEEEMLYKVFDFADTEVADVMVPRPDVVALSVDLPPEEALQAVLESPYTRYPVYRGTIDDIIGILHVRDLVAAMHDRGIAAVNLEDLLRPATMVPENKDLTALLTEFRRTNQHMAIVIDEYGTVEGIVTLEDLLEEIVGEIEDEFDLPDETVEQIDEDTIRIDGTFTIDDFNEQFHADLPITDFHTIAGFVFGALGRAAEPGDEVRYDGLVFRVDSVEGQRIDRLTVTFEQRPDEQPEAEAEAEG